MLSIKAESGLSKAGSPRVPPRPHNSRNQGIREWEPKPRPQGVIAITERASPSVRKTVGWLYPLEHYDEKLRLDPVAQYAELLLLMGSAAEPDRASLRDILAEARNRLTDAEYERLEGYAELLVPGIPTGPADERSAEPLRIENRTVAWGGGPVSNPTRLP